MTGQHTLESTRNAAPDIRPGERQILSNLFPDTQVIPEISQYQWKTHKFTAGEQLFTPGQPCNRFMLLAGGTIRIELQNRQARSILLYRIEPSRGSYVCIR